MRRKDKEITDESIIQMILSKSEICRIAIADDEAPYIVPLNYGYQKGAIYFHSAPEGRKINLLRKNNRVGFEIELSHQILKDEVSCNWTAKYRSVMGHGTIEILNSPDQIRDGLQIIMAHYGKTDNVFDDRNMKRVVILKLTISAISGKQSGEWSD